MTSASGSVSARTTRTLQASSRAGIAEAAALLRGGGLVAMPTETVYGLAANALDEAAVASIFAAKGRPGWDPLIIHVCDLMMLSRVVREIPAEARALLDAFWPGPLTLLLPRHGDLPLTVTAGRDLVGVRMPQHPVALQLIRESGVPLAAPSANRFGHISPTSVAHVLADLEGRIDAVVDGGSSEIGVESTVLDPVARVLYRQGGVSRSQIADVLGQTVTVYQRQSVAEPESLPSPGVGIRHYAPRAKLVLVADESALRKALRGLPVEGTGVMLPAEWTIDWAGKAFRWEQWDNPAGLARTLYTGLRSLDADGVTTIVCPLPPAGEGPLVEAIRDRLMKAAREA